MNSSLSCFQLFVLLTMNVRNIKYAALENVLQVIIFLNKIFLNNIFKNHFEYRYIYIFDISNIHYSIFLFFVVDRCSGDTNCGDNQVCRASVKGYNDCVGKEYKYVFFSYLINLYFKAQMWSLLKVNSKITLDVARCFIYLITYTPLLKIA